MTFNNLLFSEIQYYIWGIGWFQIPRNIDYALCFGKQKAQLSREYFFQEAHGKGWISVIGLARPNARSIHLMQAAEPNRSMQITRLPWVHSYNQWSTSDRCRNHRLVPAKCFQTRFIFFPFSNLLTWRQIAAIMGFFMINCFTGKKSD